ncbi:MAG: TetR/AcrR family transcriptional regulator [Steroidobacteraceae bacterium]
MARKAAKAVARGGRPSRADALRLRDRILAAATELFLAEGYGLTSIAAVAARAGISKRTFYDRFDDKEQLFAAVVHRIIEHIRPPPEVPLLAGAALPDELRRLAGFMLRAAVTPQALALHRLVIADAVRFPELVRAVASDRNTSEGIALISGLLARELHDSKLSDEDRAFAAQQFIDMVVTLPRRRAMGFGKPMTAAELEAWADKVVALFLDGCRGWSA